MMQTLDHPERAGKAWDIAFYADPAPRGLATDPDVAGADRVDRSVADFGNLSVPLYGVKAVGSALHMSVLAGRAPTGPDEVALGPSTADLLHVAVGDRIAAAAGNRRALRVVGTALLWEDNGQSAYDEGAWVTDVGYRSLRPAEPYWSYYFVDVSDDLDVRVARHRIEAAGGVYAPKWPRPAGLTNLRTVRAVPLIVGIVISALGAAGLGYALAKTRRRQHDVALLRALGMPVRRVRAVLLWQAANVVAIGLVIGIPAGLLAGRLLWRLIAGRTPVEYVAPFAGGAVLAVIPAALLVGLATAWWPTRTHLRTSPDQPLRAE
jgi:ABC-type lipoprotein release transport system permease subunit